MSLPRAARRLLRQPLLHFLVVGAALAAIQSVLWPALPPPPEPIVVDAATVAILEADWIGSTGRAPTDAELDLAVRDWVDQELLVRAALDHGVQHTDAIIQRRLIQNQRFLEQRDDERGDAREQPSNDQLLQQAFALGLERSDLVVRRRLVERMREIILNRTRSEQIPPEAIPTETETWTRLSQLYLSRARHGPDLLQRAQQLREQLLADDITPETADLAGMGDPLLVPRDLPPMTHARLASRLGFDFADAVLQAPVGSWSAPIPSSYGLHLVWIHERRQRATRTISEQIAAQDEARERAALQEALQILRRDVDVIRYDRATSPQSPEKALGRP